MQNRNNEIYLIQNDGQTSTFSPIYDKQYVNKIYSPIENLDVRKINIAKDDLRNMKFKGELIGQYQS